MVERTNVDNWLRAYVEAWRSHDSEQIGALFSEDAVYYPDPYSDALYGRQAIVDGWLSDDPMSSKFEARYAGLIAEGDTAVATGTTLYLEHKGKPGGEYSNVFILRFDEEGRCSEYREWFMKKPEKRTEQG